MDKYKAYDIEQFVWDDSFRQWVRFPSPGQDAEWQAWIRLNPDKADTVLQAREVILSLKVEEPPLSEAEIEKSVKKALQQIEGHDLPVKGPGYIRWLRGFGVAGNAAAVIAALCLSWWWYRTNHAPASEAAGGQAPQTQVVNEQRVNQTDTTMEVRLADGSLVVLRPHSQISYPPQFSGQKREVFLSGEAYFDIVSDPAHPFFVNTDDIVTKVLGTSFWVRSFREEEGARVRVESGRVAVFKRELPAEAVEDVDSGEKDAIIVLPNQQVVYSRKEARLQKDLVEKPAVVSPAYRSYRFVYDEAPVSRAFRDLAEAYGVEIIFDESLNGCPVTASISALPLYEQLRILCKTINAQYTLEDGKIIIEGSACK